MNARPVREANRLKQYDYSQADFYFVTLCIQGRVCLLGDIVNDNMILNNAGNMIENSWRQLPDYYGGVEIDSCQIMPNHLHGIIILSDVGIGPRACPPSPCPPRACPGQPQGVVPTTSLSDVIGRFKSFTTNRYIDGVKHHQWSPFDKKLWQRSFYDHVIRNNEDLNRVREYIQNNPLKWALDKDNPDNWAEGEKFSFWGE